MKAVAKAKKKEETCMTCGVEGGLFCSARCKEIAHNPRILSWVFGKHPLARGFFGSQPQPSESPNEASPSTKRQRRASSLPPGTRTVKGVIRAVAENIGTPGKTSRAVNLSCGHRATVSLVAVMAACKTCLQPPGMPEKKTHHKERKNLALLDERYGPMRDVVSREAPTNGAMVASTKLACGHTIVAAIDMKRARCKFCKEGA